MEATSEQKQRLQRFLLPQGLRFRNGRFGTAVTSLVFRQLEVIEKDESELASPTGVVPEWTRPVPGEVPAGSGTGKAA